jgi:alpha-acetolactate decarboxylase
MFYRMFGLATLALGMFVGATALAEDAKEGTHDGKVVSISGEKLVMTAGKEGQEHSHTLARDVKLTLDGKACKIADLKAGTRIRVTTTGADKQLATRIEGLDKNPDFAASNRQDGKFVSVTGKKLVMTGTEGSQERTCTLAVDAKITCDGKVCKAADLKPGMRIRVTTDSEAPNDATQVEALDKNADFARI